MTPHTKPGMPLRQLATLAPVNSESRVHMREVAFP